MTRIVQKDLNNWPVVGDFPFIEVKTIVFDGTAGAGAIGSIPLFSVTGDVLVDCFGICSADLVGATATLRMGTAANPGGIIATTTATDVDNNTSWDDSTPSSGEQHVATASIIGNGQDIALDVAVAAITAGTLKIYCMWRPLTQTADVVAA